MLAIVTREKMCYDEYAPIMYWNACTKLKAAGRQSKCNFNAILSFLSVSQASVVVLEMGL